MGEYPRGHHPASRAALVPFRKGHDPRRQHGAPSFGGQITAMINELGRTDDEDNALYSEDELKEMVSDPRSSHARVIAAREILRARMEGFDRIDRVPKAANSIDRILDRTLGKPTQTLRIERMDRALRDVAADMAELVAGDPTMLDEPWVVLQLVQAARRSVKLRELLRPILEIHRPEMVASLAPAIDTTAEAVELPEGKTATALPPTAAAAENIAVKDIRRKGE